MRLYHHDSDARYLRKVLNLDKVAFIINTSPDCPRLRHVHNRAFIVYDGIPGVHDSGLAFDALKNHIDIVSAPFIAAKASSLRFSEDILRMYPCNASVAHMYDLDSQVLVNANHVVFAIPGSVEGVMAHVSHNVLNIRNLYPCTAKFDMYAAFNQIDLYDFYELLIEAKRLETEEVHAIAAAATGASHTVQSSM